MRDLGPAACVGGKDAIMLTCRDPRTLTPLAHHSARAQKPVILSTSTTRTSGVRMGGCKPWLASAAAAAIAAAGAECSGHETHLCDGVLWTAVGRRAAAPAESEVHMRRQKGLIAGVGHSKTRAGAVEESGVAAALDNAYPVLLVRVESVRGADGGTSAVGGWDVVLPRKWALPVWVALIKCGCRALALRESQVIFFFSNCLQRFLKNLIVCVCVSTCV